MPQPRRRSLLGMLMPQPQRTAPLNDTPQQVQQDGNIGKRQKQPRRLSLQNFPRRMSLTRADDKAILASNSTTSHEAPLNAQHQQEQQGGSIEKRQRQPRRLSLQNFPRRRMSLTRTGEKAAVVSASASASASSEATSSEESSIVSSVDTSPTSVDSTSPPTVSLAVDEEWSIPSLSPACYSHNNASKVGKKIKCVRFARRNQNEYYTNSTYSHDECHDLWLCRDELKKQHEALKFLAQGLERAEKFSAHNPNSYTNVLLYVYARCTEYSKTVLLEESPAGASDCTICLTQEEMQELTHRLKLSSNRLGLEGRIIPQFRKERYAQRSKMLQQIQHIQNNITSANGINGKAQQIRLTCEGITKPSRLFSWHMAQAHAGTLKNK